MRSRSRRVVVPAVVAALGFGLLAAIAGPAAAAVDRCTDDDPYCPIANEDEYTTAFNTVKIVAKPGVLSNDRGISSTKVDLEWSDTESAAGATVVLKADGSFSYWPDPENPFTGIDSFDYWLIDNNEDSDFSTVYITVTPTVATDAYTVQGGTRIVAAPGVLANDVGVDSESAVLVDDSNAHGEVVLAGDGSFEYAADPGFSGAASFDYSVLDLNADLEYTATVSLTVLSAIDNIAPTKPSFTSPSATVTRVTSFNPAWTASTDASGIANYDVHARVAPWNGGFGAWGNVVAAQKVTSTPYTTSAGRTVCFRARARDIPGNTSDWTSDKCTAIPLRSTAFTYSGGWTQKANGDVYGGVLYNTNAKGAKATRAGAQAKRIYLVVTKCASCGTIQVRWNNAVIANVGLASPTTVRKQVVGVGTFASTQAGTLTVTVTSTSGKTVIIEGVAFARF